MFEAGRSDALSADKQRRIAEVLGIDVRTLPRVRPRPTSRGPLVLKFCPADDCPSNVPYVVKGRLCVMPSMVEAPEDEVTRCGYCGEVLEHRCPNPECEAVPGEGAFCTSCGTAYVSIARDRGVPESAWAEEQRVRIRDVRAMARTRKRAAATRV
jgi:hypothetical protein